MEPSANIPDNDLEQNLNKGTGALWENLDGCKAIWQEENLEQKLPVERCPEESDRAAIKEKRGTRSMSLKKLHLNCMSACPPLNEICPLFFLYY